MTAKLKISLAALAAFLFVPLIGRAGNAVSTAVANLSYLGQQNLPRGMRNNNPGNIRKSGNAWQGKVKISTDTAFEQFVSYVYGVRAMIKNLLSYKRDGLDTLTKVIYRWAPPGDNNDSAAYVQFVSNRTGIGKNEKINLEDQQTMSKVLRAMCQMENFGGAAGKPEAVTVEQFQYAWNMVFNGIGAIYTDVPKIYACGDGTYSTSQSPRGCARHGGKKTGNPLSFGSGSSLLNIVDVPLNDINIDRKLFQGREKAFSQRSVDNIVNDVADGKFMWENLDPVTLWQSPEGRLFLLSGHSRHRAFEVLAELGAEVDGKNFERIPSKIRRGPLEAAQRLALDSNTLSTKETDIERAAYYRKLRQDGTDEKNLLALVKKNEGKNWPNVYSYTYLSPSGRAWAALRQFAEGEDTSATLAKSLAKWIGNARRSFPQLTGEHENELFAWLFEQRGYGTGAGQVASERDFMEKVAVFVQKNTTFGEFETERPLNILAAQQKSPSEMQFDSKIQELTKEIQNTERELKAKIRSLTERKASPEDIRRIVAPLETLLRNNRTQLAALMQKRSEVVEYSKREATLFGIRKKHQSLTL